VGAEDACKQARHPDGETTAGARARPKGMHAFLLLQLP
jgi:hypothetical protein